MEAGTRDRESGTGGGASRVGTGQTRATGDNPDAQLKRLRWRARRGTRELDALLGGWLDRHAPSADASSLEAFAALLDQQDPEIWDWLTGHASPSRADWQAIVTDIRDHAGLAP